MGSAPPVLGSNIDGGSVFANYINARNGGQFFLLWEATIQYETPSFPSDDFVGLRWCSNLGFTDIVGSGDNTNNTITTTTVGYTAHCVGAGLPEKEEGDSQQKALTSDEFNDTNSLSAVYVPHTNIFEGSYHSNTNNWLAQFSDDGRSVMTEIDWETQDAGDDTSPNAGKSWSAVGKQTWIYVEEAASLLNNNADDFTPDKFTGIYTEVWSANPSQAETVDTEDEESSVEDEESSDSSGNTRRLSVVVPSLFSTLLGYFCCNQLDYFPTAPP